MTFIEPSAPVHLLQEGPDVGDVRVGECEVAVGPVHPHAEPSGLLRDDSRVLGDAFLAALGEPCDAVFLDLALRIEPEGSLDFDLDPEALAVEAVLIALVETAESLVALEHVLQSATPAVMHSGGVVGGDGTVYEAPSRSAAVLLAQPLEDLFLVPPIQHRMLNGRMVR